MAADPIHVVYQVPSISCDHCRRTIENAVKGVAGVAEVCVDVGDKTVDVHVTGEPERQGVRQAIEDAGYPVADERIVNH